MHYKKIYQTILLSCVACLMFEFALNTDRINTTERLNNAWRRAHVIQISSFDKLYWDSRAQKVGENVTQLANSGTGLLSKTSDVMTAIKIEEERKAELKRQEELAKQKAEEVKIQQKKERNTNNSKNEKQESSVSQSGQNSETVQNNSNQDNEHPDYIRRYYNMVPSSIRSAFERTDWDWKLYTAGPLKNKYGFSVNVQAVTDWNAHVIYVDQRKSSASAIVHELGHWASAFYFTNDGYQSDSSHSEFAHCFTDEWQRVRDYFGGSSANYNTQHEYAAESFSLYILDGGKLHDIAPETWSFYSNYGI